MATQEQIDLVRGYCFYPTEAELPDNIIAAQIDKWLAVYPQPDQYAIAMYNATLDCLRYLVYTDPNWSGGSLGSSRMEKVGQVQVTQETTGEYVSRWQKILDDYLNGYLTIPGAPTKLGKGVIIGGVSAKEINRVNCDYDSVNGLGCFGVDRKQAERFPNPFSPLVGRDGRRRR